MTDQSKVAIITGASAGIGKLTAITLSKAGWKVTLAARRKSALEEAASECPGPTRLVVADVSKEADVEKVFQMTLATFGRLDLLFNNAGIGMPTTQVEEVSLDQFKAIQDVNVTGTFLCTRAAFKIFKNQNPVGGRIINNGSISAFTPRVHSFAYTASKHAVLGLSKCTSLDGRAFNISCTQIDIGGAHTDMGANLSKGVPQANGTILAEQTFNPQHVADAVLHIAQLPNDIQVLSMNIMALQAPFVGRG